MGLPITACGKLRLLCCPSQHGTTSTTSTGIFGHSHLQHVQRPLAKAENQKTHHFVLHSSHLVYWLREPQGWDGSASQGGANKNGATENANQSDVESKSAATNQQKPCRQELDSPSLSSASKVSVCIHFFCSLGQWNLPSGSVKLLPEQHPNSMANMLCFAVSVFGDYTPKLATLQNHYFTQIGAHTVMLMISSLSHSVSVSLSLSVKYPYSSICQKYEKALHKPRPCMLPKLVLMQFSLNLPSVSSNHSIQIESVLDNRLSQPHNQSLPSVHRALAWFTTTLKRGSCAATSLLKSPTASSSPRSMVRSSEPKWSSSISCEDGPRNHHNLGRDPSIQLRLNKHIHIQIHTISSVLLSYIVNFTRRRNDRQ